MGLFDDLTESLRPLMEAGSTRGTKVDRTAEREKEEEIKEEVDKARAAKVEKAITDNPPAAGNEKKSGPLNKTTPIPNRSNSISTFISSMDDIETTMNGIQGTEFGEDGNLADLFQKKNNARNALRDQMAKLEKEKASTGWFRTALIQDGIMEYENAGATRLALEDLKNLDAQFQDHLSVKADYRASMNAKIDAQSNQLRAQSQNAQDLYETSIYNAAVNGLNSAEISIDPERLQALVGLYARNRLDRENPAYDVITRAVANGNAVDLANSADPLDTITDALDSNMANPYFIKLGKTVKEDMMPRAKAVVDKKLKQENEALLQGIKAGDGNAVAQYDSLVRAETNKMIKSLADGNTEEAIEYNLAAGLEIGEVTAATGATDVEAIRSQYAAMYGEQETTEYLAEMEGKLQAALNPEGNLNDSFGGGISDIISALKKDKARNELPIAKLNLAADYIAANARNASSLTARSSGIAMKKFNIVVGESSIDLTDRVEVLAFIGKQLTPERTFFNKAVEFINPTIRMQGL